MSVRWQVRLVIQVRRGGQTVDVETVYPAASYDAALAIARGLRREWANDAEILVEVAP